MVTIFHSLITPGKQCNSSDRYFENRWKDRISKLLTHFLKLYRLDCKHLYLWSHSIKWQVSEHQSCNNQCRRSGRLLETTDVRVCPELELKPRLTGIDSARVCELRMKRMWWWPEGWISWFWSWIYSWCQVVSIGFGNWIDPVPLTVDVQGSIVICYSHFSKSSRFSCFLKEATIIQHSIIKDECRCRIFIKLSLRYTPIWNLRSCVVNKYGIVEYITFAGWEHICAVCWI